MGEYVNYNGKQLNVIYNVDTVIVGGGTAGAVAGISAAKGGNKTLIVEKSIALGGSQTNGLVTPMMPSHVESLEINNLIKERLESIGCKTKDGMTKTSWFNCENLAYVLEKLFIENQGDILYDSSLVDVIKEEDSISYIIILNCEGLVAVKAKNFIDSTGDALLSRMAGIKVQAGDSEGNNQMMSFRFEMGGIDVDKVREYMQNLNDTFCPFKEGEFYEIAFIQGRNFVLEPLFQKGYEEGQLLEESLRYFQAFTIPNKKGCMSFNCPHIIGMNHSTSAVERSKAVSKGRELMNILAKFLIKNMPGFENAYFLKEAVSLGVRESYRIIGQYILTEEDYLKRATFEDGIVKGDWYLDVHSVKKRAESEDKKYTKGEYYEIPYRSLVTNEVTNLIVVGRCISTTFLMQSSVRIQPTLRDLAQVAGEACVYSIKNNISLKNINGSVLRRDR